MAIVTGRPRVGGAAGHETTLKVHATQSGRGIAKNLALPPLFFMPGYGPAYIYFPDSRPRDSVSPTAATGQTYNQTCSVQHFIIITGGLGAVVVLLMITITTIIIVIVHCGLLYTHQDH